MAKQPQLHIKHIKTNKTVKSITLSQTNDRYVEKVMSGLLRNMSDDYYVDDSELYSK